jgi:3-deoxy-manno-octulosonate cytidylyltransferase (CMP-KDO synthetase)
MKNAAIFPLPLGEELCLSPLPLGEGRGEGDRCRIGVNLGQASPSGRGSTSQPVETPGIKSWGGKPLIDAILDADATYRYWQNPMHIAVVIPARYASSRFPGKPLAPVAGVSLLQRVWRLAQAADGIDSVTIATDDDRIRTHAEGFGAQVVMTPASCRNGTERVHAALDYLPVSCEAVINLQGDAVLTPPWVITALAAALRTTNAPMVTPAVQCTPVQYRALVTAKQDSPASGTLVVCDRRGRALYFSKALIPFLRDMSLDTAMPLPVWRHIGLYGYRRDALAQLLAWPEGPLEAAEQLEQLRALENGMDIQVVPVDYRGRTHWSIDSLADVAHAEHLLAREGELC